MDTNLTGAPSYERMAESIREDIRRGRLTAGTKLAGNRALADHYGVALGTAQKALQVLREQGWLTATPSVGVFANEPPDETAEETQLAALSRRVEQLEAHLTELTERIERTERATGSN